MIELSSDYSKPALCSCCKHAVEIRMYALKRAQSGFFAILRAEIHTKHTYRSTLFQLDLALGPLPVQLITK